MSCVMGTAARAMRPLGLPASRWMGVAVVLWLAAAVCRAAPVLLISVDGLKPEYVLEADAHGLKTPYLRGLLATGAYATGVTGVWPTVTYPSHTTLVTGVTPAEHGIPTNLAFDPQREYKDAWYWYGRQIRVPTLWDIAHAAGRVTASVGWPVTVGAPHIDYLIPEFWRGAGVSGSSNPADRELIGALSRPDGLLERMRPAVGEYMMGNDTTLRGDLIKTRFAIEILREHKPGFMTIHLSSLDDAQHAHGTYSPEANGDLEQIDSLLAQLAAAARSSDQTAIVTVVSDHGFENLSHSVDLTVPFRQAGLLDETPDPITHAGKVTAWKAQPWNSGGMAAIMMHDPDDRAAALAVQELLSKLAADPNNGIAAVKGAEEIRQAGAFPGAAFLVVFQPGYYAAVHSTGKMVAEISDTRGGHGFSPEYAEMRSAFFIEGRGIAEHRNLGLIDMRQIAPTLAQLMGGALPAARLRPLRVAR